jgi:prevent-host-death family protein
MIKNMTMIVVNIFEAKAKLSEYLDLASSGERVLICKRNRPVAELRPVEAARTGPRPVGLGHGRVIVGDAFFAPLPDDMLDAFNGGLGAAVTTPAQRVAESSPAYGVEKPGGKGRAK